MTRHRFRDSLKSFFGSHIDPDKDEQLKGTKTEIDDKVKKILKLIKEKNLEEQDGIPLESSKKEPLVELIEDFHRHYQSLYAQYDHLTGELRKKFHSKKETETFSSSSSDSESDSSSKNKSSKNGKLESEYQKITEVIKKELETVNLEVADLKSKLRVTNEEMEALNLEHQTALNKIQDADEIIKNLKHEVEKLDSEKTELKVENAELKEKIDAADRVKAELNQRIKDMNKEKENLFMEKKAAMRRVEEGEKILQNNETLIQMESQKAELMNQIADHQRKLDEQKEAYKKLTEEYKQVEARFQECKENLEVAERKLEETGQESHNYTGSKDKMMAELEDTIDDLRRDLEVKGDELNTLVENVRSIEFKLRLSNQKLRLTEQFLTENEESFRQAKAKYREDLQAFEEKVSTLRGVIAANNAAYQRMVKDISDKVNSTLIGMENLTLKLEEDCNRQEHRLSEMSQEIKIAKNWAMETNNEKQQLQNEVSDSILQLSALGGEVEQLKVKMNTEEKEKENMLKSVSQMKEEIALMESKVRKKDEGLSELGEEKKEAIRQLCIGIDYHRSRYDYLREMLSKMPVRVQRAA